METQKMLVSDYSQLKMANKVKIRQNNSAATQFVPKYSLGVIGSLVGHFWFRMGIRFTENYFQQI